MNKALVFDLDGTLLNSKKTITRETADTLKRCNDIGYRVIIATARPPRYADFVKELLPFEIEMIYYNGGLFKTSNEDVCKTIHKSINREIFTYVTDNDPQAKISLEREDKWYTHQEFDYNSYFNIPVGPEVVSYDSLLDISPNKILILHSEISDKIENNFSSLVNLSITDNGELIQVNEKATSKASGIKTMVESFGISMEDVTCFGDDYNDIEMFKKCGTSVAMGNGVDELKNIATHITDTNDRDGIMIYLNKILEEELVEV